MQKAPAWVPFALLVSFQLTPQKSNIIINDTDFLF